jgi:hypothetical protein
MEKGMSWGSFSVVSFSKKQFEPLTNPVSTMNAFVGTAA